MNDMADIIPRGFDSTVISNEYDSAGRLYRVYYPDSTNTFNYYSNNLLKIVANEVGTVANTYNFANRFTNSVGIAPSGTVSYTYFPAGQVSNVTSVAGTIEYNYDAAERVSSVSTVNGEQGTLNFLYSYNTNNGLISKTTCTNSGVFVDYTYDVMDRVTGIAWNDSSTNVLKSFSYSYNNAGMITNVSLDSGAVLQYTYDDLDRLSGEKRISTNSETLYDISYSYDEVGNRMQKAYGDVTVSYTFPYGSSGNRLSSWSTTSTNNFESARTLDVSGYASEAIGTNPALGQLWVSNTTAVTPAVDGTNFTAEDFVVGFGTQQIVVAIGDVAGNVGYATNTIVGTVVTDGAYTYNSAGCITNISYTGSNYSKTVALSWNQQYQITSVATNGVTAESYQYDALGRRTRIVSGSTTNYLVYDGIHVIAEVNSAGTLQKSYTYGPGIDNILAMTDHTTTNTYYYLTDHLGSVHALTDSSGSIVEQYRYDAWGRVSVYDGDREPLEESAYDNRFLWQGREYSWDTGLYYFRARWYDPITGRWLSKDPIGISGGLNQYSPFHNNPVIFVDPEGLRQNVISAGGEHIYYPHGGYISVNVPGATFEQRSASGFANAYRMSEPVIVSFLVAGGIEAAAIGGYYAWPYIVQYGPVAARATGRFLWQTARTTVRGTSILLDATDARAQKPQLTNDCFPDSGLSYSNYCNFPATHPNLLQLDIPSARSIGEYPDDFEHWHMGLEVTSLPTSVVNKTNDLENAADQDADTFPAFQDNTAVKLVDLLNATYSETNISFTLTHTYESGEGADAKYVDPERQKALKDGDPIRNIRYEFTTNAIPKLSYPGQEDDAAWERGENEPPQEIWQVGLFINRKGEIVLIGAGSGGWQSDWKVIWGMQSDALREE